MYKIHLKSLWLLVFKDRQNAKKDVLYKYGKRGVMKVSAVGFLFQDRIKSKNLRGNNYTCIIHKVNQNGNYIRNIFSSPLVKKTILYIVSTEHEKEDVIRSLKAITAKEKGSKFIGATVKDGIKETEIHSLLSDKLFAVRTRDDLGKNHFSLLGKAKTQKLLASNLYLKA